ncbi:hypothetical protein bmMN180001_000883 (plasmid) [Borrelia miyamotoi]
MIQEIQENLDRTQESQDTTNTNTEELRNTQESVNLNLKDYEEYRVYKAEKEKEHINKNLSINERISREAC